MTAVKDKWADFRVMADLWLWTVKLLWNSHAVALTIALVGALAQTATSIGQLWVTKLLIDKAIWAISLPRSAFDSAAIQSVLIILAAEAGLLLFGLLAATVSSHYYNVLSEHFTYDVQFRIFDQVSTLDLEYYESAEYFDLMMRAQREAGTGPVTLLRRIFESLQAILGLSSMIGLIIFYKPWIALILIATIVPSFYVASKYGRKRFILFDGRTPDGRRAGYLGAIIGSDIFAKEVRIWGIENYLIRQLDNLYARFKGENIDLSFKESVARFGSEIIATGGYYASYVVVVIGVITRVLTVGDLSLYAGAFSRAQAYFEQVVTSVARTYEALLFAHNLRRFFELERTIQEAPNAVAAPSDIETIDFSDLAFTYPNTNRVVLNELNCTVRKGECVAIVGTNGAGKTSLIKLLLRLYDPTGGGIKVNGADIRDFEIDSWRQQIGVVFQDYAKYQLTLKENIGFGRIDSIENDADICRAAEDAGIGDLLTRFPEGLDAQLGRRFEGGYELSIGQWQRIALARALLRDAPLLVMDEPSAALDAQAEYELYSQLKEFSQDRITILVSHRFSTVRMADRILVMQDGKIIEEGTHESLLHEDTEYARLFKLQAENYQMAPAAEPELAYQ